MADVNTKFDLISVSARNLDLPNGNINLKVSSKEADASLLARIMEPVYEYLNDYRKTAINPSIQEYDKRLDGMTDRRAAEKLAQQVNDELKKLVGNLEKEAQTRIVKSWDRIKKENKEFTKWKIKIAARVTWGVVKIGKGISALIASAGAKADEYYKIAKSVYDIAKEVQKGIATEEKVRGQVMTAVEKLAKATKDGKAGKSDVKKVEDAVKEYRVKLTNTRQKASSMAGPLEKLLQLKDQGVEVTRKQEKQINDMIAQTIEFNTIEQNGRKFADEALKKAQDTKATMDLKRLKGHADKVRKGIEMAAKVFRTAAEIL